MKEKVISILLLAVSYSFCLPMETTEEDPAEELENLLENANDEDRGCRDISLYWCRGYSSRCSHPMVYGYCPKTCGRCLIARGWSAWSAYGPCSKSCHYGYQTRSRQCNSRSSPACQGPSVQRRRCNERVSCSSDRAGPISALRSGEGKWSPWSSYTKCSKSCGTGTQSRTRTCINPSQPLNHRGCPGPFRQHRPCNQNPCPVDGGWTSWGPFRQCSKNCGGGSQYKHRKCKNPPPKHGGKMCPGPFTLSRECNTQPCAVDGAWSPWGVFGQCSQTCGGGVKHRSRICDNPTPSSGGRPCQGPSQETTQCNTQFCAVEGQWSPWSPFGQCSKRCGGGIQYRSRACNNPPPSSGGKDCPGPSRGSKACNSQACSVDGQWSSWGMFSSCRKSCGGGMKYRTRTCNNPAPSSGGKPCQGPSQESMECNTNACAIDGQWSQWSIFGSCSQTCGGGFKHRYRKCDNPAPASGGQDCQGASFQSVACNTQRCPVHGQWSSWSRYSRCSKRYCGGGSQYRVRKCNNPAPANGGRVCEGPNRQSRSCNTRPCRVNGGWSSWGPYSRCSVTCGSGGRQTRHRTCTNPPPAGGGRRCSGYSRQTRGCSSGVPCPQIGCRDIQYYGFCKYVVMSYKCGQYYIYCRKSCNACNYRKAY